MADAAAKEYLTQPHDPHEMATSITQICKDIAVIHGAHSGNLRDRWIYCEVKRLSTQWILQQTSLSRQPTTTIPTSQHEKP